MLASIMQTMLYSACPEKTCQVRLQHCVFALLPNFLVMLGLSGLQIM